MRILTRDKIMEELLINEVKHIEEEIKVIEEKMREGEAKQITSPFSN